MNGDARGRAYDPDLAAVIATIPPLDLTDVTTARATMAAIRRSKGEVRVPDWVRIRRSSIRSIGASVDVTIVTRVDTPTPAAGLVWLHGGGFVLGDVASDLPVLIQFVTDLNIVVVAVDYRRAPEHPYPTPLADCYAAAEWTAVHAGRLGIDADRIGIAGVSAGGGLAAAVTLQARDQGGPALAFQSLDVPVVDDRLVTESMRSFVDTPMWTRGNAESSWAMYLGPDDGEVSQYAAPARAADLTALPPAHVTACQFDPIRDEAIAYAGRLAAAGVPTELHVYPGTFHGSMTIASDAPVSQRMTQDRIAAIARGLTAGRVGRP